MRLLKFCAYMQGNVLTQINISIGKVENGWLRIRSKQVKTKLTALMRNHTFSFESEKVIYKTGTCLI